MTLEEIETLKKLVAKSHRSDVIRALETMEAKLTDGLPTLTFEQELRTLINRRSLESASNTPDFILAAFLLRMLEVFAETVNARDRWFSFTPFGVRANPFSLETMCETHAEAIERMRGALAPLELTEIMREAKETAADTAIAAPLRDRAEAIVRLLNAVYG